MATPGTGPLKFSEINQELGLASTTQISMSSVLTRGLAGVPSGAIKFSDLRGKSYRVTISHTFTINTPNATLDVTAISGYAAGRSDITVTVNSGVYLYATAISSAGLTLTGGTSGDTIKLVNNGYIIGCGGAGGGLPNYGSGAGLGQAGGPALSLGFTTTVDNTNAGAYIAGGGGGGGSCYYSTNTVSPGGGGAGGGSGGGASIFSGDVAAGGSGGGLGSAGTSGGTLSGTYWVGGGAGGGRSLTSATGGSGGQVTTYGPSPGTRGNMVAATSGGAGGGGGFVSASATQIPAGQSRTVLGGAGGTTGAGGAATGGQIGYASYGGGGGGGWGAIGGATNAPVKSGGPNPKAPGNGGKSVALNGFTVTWTSGNTTRVYGQIA